MSKIIELTLYKHLEIPETTLCNVIVDGLLSCNYSLAKAQNIAEDVMSGALFLDERKNLCLNKINVLDAIKRYCSKNTDMEIELFTEAANEIFRIIISDYNNIVV